jgi:hypothetical protein
LQYAEAVGSGKLNLQPAPAAVTTVATMPSLNEVMGFSGSGPEIINGRLSMLGFVAAVAAELSSGGYVVEQFG